MKKNRTVFTIEMLHNIKIKLNNNIKNLPGGLTNKRIIVIEADDWGSIRMPSKEVYTNMLKDGLPLGNDRYTKYDTLANKKDLELLFETLLSVKDKNGNNAVISVMSNVANPDFVKIKESEYKAYYFEPFTTTLNKYYPNEAVFNTWLQGIKEGIFLPQLHGREHISVQLWLNKLQQKDPAILKSFDFKFVALNSNKVNQNAKAFRPEFFFESPNQIDFLKNSIASGIQIFEEIFQYKPKIFVPSNGIFHPIFESKLIMNEIRYLYTNTFMPIPDGKGGLKKRYLINGKQNKNGLRYYIRNCVFEPTDNNYPGIDYTLAQIEAAFRWKKPANISTHRVNFVGGIASENREKGLNELRALLKAIVKKWPNVEFMNSVDMLDLLYKNYA